MPALALVYVIGMKRNLEVPNELSPAKLYQNERTDERSSVLRNRLSRGSGVDRFCRTSAQPAQTGARLFRLSFPLHFGQILVVLRLQVSHRLLVVEPLKISIFPGGGQSLHVALPLEGVSHKKCSHTPLVKALQAFSSAPTISSNFQLVLLCLPSRL